MKTFVNLLFSCFISFHYLFLFQGQNLSLVDNNAATKTSVKSQAMDDVLEILIRNGGRLKNKSHEI